MILQRKAGFKPNGWGVFAFLLAGAALWWSYLDSKSLEPLALCTPFKQPFMQLQLSTAFQ